MANEAVYGSTAGSLAGAGLGFALGGPAGAALGAGLGGSGGSLIGSFFSKRPKAPDISGELNNLRALIDELRQSGLKAIDQDYGNQRGETASNLAARGVYRSPVSQNSFDRLNRARMAARSSFLGDLAGREASLRAGLLGQLVDVNSKYNMLGGQQEAARAGQLASLFSGLLQAGLKYKMATPSSNGEAVSMPPSQPWQNNYFSNLLSNSPMAPQGPTSPFTSWYR